MWNINKNQQINKLIDTNNRIVITRGAVGTENEEGKGGQI